VGDELKPGLRESLLTPEVEAAVAEAAREGLHPQLASLADAEAADRVSRHVAAAIARAIADAPEGDRAQLGIRLARELLELVEGAAPAQIPVEPGQVLRAILRILPGGAPEVIERPLTPLVDTTVFTNARGEPAVGRELRAEIHSADAVDVVIAFIRFSGIAPLLEPLRQHVAAGKRVRVLTTTYTNSTEQRALDELRQIGADIRVSYDTSTTRLHAKAWLFHRGGGYSTAYVGSSNLTYSAQVTGLEWNVRLSAVRNPDAVTKIGAVFESYWASSDFVPYDATEFAERTQVQTPDGALQLPLFDLELRPFQERLLELLGVSRAAGHHRNLLVAATGTGKTVMAALDYERLRSMLPRARLLVVAHREEILKQSRATFRLALRDPTFGELRVGGVRPTRFDYVFASIQSLSAAGPSTIDPELFDVVIVDEFHHAAAPTYRELLERLAPRELLGLTATPERSDGLDVLNYFDGRIAAELRVWDAIDQQYLAPFTYYGIHDGLDLTGITWRRGTGYDIDELTNVLTADHLAARRIIDQLRQKVANPKSIRALGFCVSVNHARFMARDFNQLGLPSVAVWGDTPRSERERALRDLATGEVNVVFTVDLFNEGVDVPNVDTLLLLRPTDSATLFLQQLGRGLRRAPGKASCLVLDFVGLHRKEFRFDRRFRALLGGSRKELERQVTQGFPFLPAGCHLELDAVAQAEVLRSIRESLPSTWRDRVAELRALGDVPLRTYLDETGLDLGDLYMSNRSWSELRRAAGVTTQPEGPAESQFLRAVGRLLHVDDAERIDAYCSYLSQASAPKVGLLSVRELRLLRMLVASLTNLRPSASFTEALEQLWQHPQVRSELIEVLEYLKPRINHLHVPLSVSADIPLYVHARYTRLEILAAFGRGSGARPDTWQTGVLWDETSKSDLFAFTLDKSGGGFSPTTRYEDYAISPELIHWQSQSATAANSRTARRYIQHRANNTNIVLFARLAADDRAFWCLGPATYVEHEGDRPVSFKWRLENRLPGDLYAQFGAAVA
jgi:superfamily II DNA or RNA helicase